MKNIFNLKQKATLGLLGLLTTSSLIAPLSTRAADTSTINEDNNVTVELVLAVDVSTSVDYQEFELQRKGYIAAFQDAEVQQAINNLPEGLAVNMSFWADKNAKDIGWFKLQNDGNGNITNLQSFIDAMNAVVRRGNTDENGNRYSSGSQQVVINGVTTNMGGGTDIKLAIDSAKNMLLNNQFQGKALIIDVSGDGVSDDTPYTGSGNENNECGHQHNCPPLEAARDAAIDAGITINGLPINNQESKNLANEVDIHYEKLVYGGKGAFVELSNGFNDFTRAAKTKILREIIEAGERAKAAAVNDFFVTDEETSFSGNVLTNDKDPKNEGLQVAKVNGAALNVGQEITLPSGALVTLNLDGSLVYNPNAQFDSLNDGEEKVDTFSYSISNGVDSFSTASVSINVEGIGVIYAD